MVPTFIFEELILTGGYSLSNCEYLAEAGAPRGFIAVKSNNSPKGYLSQNMVHFIKVSNIVSFSVNEKDLELVWGLFETVPEEIRVIRGF